MENIDSRPMEDQSMEYCVETIEENEVIFMLQDLHRKIDNIEKKIDQRMFVIETGVEAIVGAFEGYYQENVNFRNEMRNAFQLTAQRIFEADTADYELILPCNTPKCVAVLEKRVRDDPKAKKELRKRFFELSAKDWKAFVRRAMELVWTPDTAENFSWSGQRDNIPVKYYKIILMMKDVTRVKYKLPPTANAELDRIMKRWFFYAGSRSRLAKELDINDPDMIMNRRQIRDEITGYVDPKMSNDHDNATVLSDDDKNNYDNDSMDDPDYLENDGDGETYEIEELDEQQCDSLDTKTALNFENDEDPIKFSKSPIVLIEKLKHTTPETGNKKSITASQSVPTSIDSKEDVHKLKAFRLPCTVMDLLPIKTNEDIQKVEILLKVGKYRLETLEMLKKMKRECKETNINFSKIYSDPFLKEYSWNGKNDHKSLENLKLSKLLIEAWKEPNQDSADFEKSLRVCVFQSHTRTVRTQQISNSSQSAKKLRLS